MKLHNQADVERWLASHVRDAKAVLRAAGLTGREVERIAAGTPIMLAIEKARPALERITTDRKVRAAEQVLSIVRRIRNAEPWQLLPLGHLLARTSIDFAHAEVELHYTAERNRRASGKQRGKPKSPVTVALENMIEIDDEAITADGVIAIAALGTTRKGVRVMKVGKRVRFADLATGTTRTVERDSIQKALSRIRKPSA